MTLRDMKLQSRRESPEAGYPSHVALSREKFSARAIIICAQMKFNDALSELKLNQRGKLQNYLL